MNKTQLRELIREVILEVISETETPAELEERTVARRAPPRKMTAAQVARRDKIGKAMKAKPNVVAKYKKQYGEQDWESYLWAAATNAAMQ